MEACSMKAKKVSIPVKHAEYIIPWSNIKQN